MNALARQDVFDFRGDKVSLWHLDGDQYLPFGKVCDLFGLNVQTEWREIQSYPWLKTRVEVDRYGARLYMIQLRSVPFWLPYVKPERLPHHLRGRQADYCKELVDAAWSYTTTGIAVNERIIGPEVKARLLEAVTRGSEILLRHDPEQKDVMLAKASIRNVLIVLNGQAASGIDQTTVALQCDESGHRLSEDDVKQIGKLVAADYRARTGRDPIRNKGEVKGHWRNVCYYTAADVPHITRIIADYVAQKARGR